MATTDLPPAAPAPDHALAQAGAGVPAALASPAAPDAAVVGDRGLRAVTDAAAVVAPLSMLAGTVAFALGGDLNEGRVAGTIMIWAAGAYALALPGLAGRLRGWWAAFVGVAGAVGAAGIAAYGMDAIQREVSGATVVGSDITPLALRIPGLLLPLALLVLGVGLARSRAAAEPAAWGLAAAAVLFPVSRITNVIPLALGCDLLVLVSVTAIVRTAGTPRRHR